MTQTCSAFCLVWLTSTVFGLHADNKKFSSENEELISILIITYHNFTHVLFNTSCARKIHL